MTSRVSWPEAHLALRGEVPTTMPKKQKVERDARSIVSFQPQHLNDLSDSLAASPWPTVGDVLIRTSIGNEKWIFPLSAWEKNDLEHLSYFAMQYHEVARSRVGAWLTGGRQNPETIIYGVAFAFRHAIEVTLKSLTATDESFQAKSAFKKQKALHGHDIVALVAHLKQPLKTIGFSADEVKPVRKLIAELQHLDDRSDGFRYPFLSSRESSNRSLRDYITRPRLILIHTQRLRFYLHSSEMLHARKNIRANDKIGTLG
jgi:hypothetical protein